MKLVVEIDEATYEDIKKGKVYSSFYDVPLESVNAIANGTPLPKGHGRLIDVDDIRVIELEDSLHFMQHKKGDDVDVYIDAPTIIEADKAERSD